MAIAARTLWIVSMTAAAEDVLLNQAVRVGAQAVAVRTTSARLPNAIARFHEQNIKVYGWRWPAVVPGPHNAPHYYADDEAAYVVEQLLPAGLDGYIVDPESDKGSPVNDWNNSGLAALARSFCATIRGGAAAAGKDDFHFGVTSGCRFPTVKPNIPWAEFVAASHAVYPQTYWKMRNGAGQVISINGGTPVSALDKGRTSWETVSDGKPIIPIAGELDSIDASEITEFGSHAEETGAGEAHFYTVVDGVPDDNYAAIANL